MAKERAGIRLSASIKTVADVPHCLDKATAGVFYLAAKSPYVDIDGPVTTKVVIPPDAIKQGVASKNPARIVC